MILPNYYAIQGRLKSAQADKLPSSVSFNEQLSQQTPRVKLFARVLDENDKLVGLIGLIEAENLAQAQAFLKRSPLYHAYQEAEVARVEFEVGRPE